jgi:hypothetical protein
MATVAAWLYGVKHLAMIRREGHASPECRLDLPRTPAIGVTEFLCGGGGTCERLDAYPIIWLHTFLAKETGMATTVQIIEFSDYL